MSQMGETISTQNNAINIEMFAIKVIIDLLISVQMEPSLEAIEIVYNEVIPYAVSISGSPIITVKTQNEISSLLRRMEKEANLFEHFFQNS